MVNSFTAAVVQQAIADNNKRKNMQSTENHIREAAEQGAELVVLQELHTTKYFCQVEFSDFFDFAEPLNGPSYQFFAELAAELDIVLVMSGFEKRAPGLYHNTAQVIQGREGRVGIYRKMHIPDDPGFYEKFYFTPGDTQDSLAGAQPLAYNGFKPIKTRLGNIGLLVCWDQWYPEAARLMALAGADVLVYPTAIGWDPNDDDDEQQRQREAWLTIQRAHAVANGIPVIVANRTGYEAAPIDGQDGIEFWGSSFVCGPQGEYILEPKLEVEGAYIARIDLARSESVRRIWPYLRDRRVDAYGNLTRRWVD